MAENQAEQRLDGARRAFARPQLQYLTEEHEHDERGLVLVRLREGDAGPEPEEERSDREQHGERAETRSGHRRAAESSNSRRTTAPSARSLGSRS